MLKMNEVHVVRHKYYNEGRSIRQIALEMGINWRTVKRYLGQAEPRREEKNERCRPVWGQGWAADWGCPDKSFQLVRYYGWYSNKMRGQRDKRAAEEAAATWSAKWRELIKKANCA